MDSAAGQFFYDTFTNAVIDIMGWVVFSLLLFETINLISGDKFYKKIEKSKYTQPIWAALMGSIPGCGGPILLTSLYVQGTMTFGSLSASFIATFGDAAFVILAVDPIAFLWLLVISFIVGIFMGYLIDLTPLHKFIDKRIVLGEDKRSKKKEEKERKKHKFNEYKKPSRTFIFYDEKVMGTIFFIMFLFIFPATIMDVVLETKGIEPLDSSGFALYYTYFADVLSVIIILVYVTYFFVRKYLVRGFDDRNHFDMVIDSNKNGKDAGTTIKDYENEYNEMHNSMNTWNGTKKYVFLTSIFIMTWVFFGLAIFGLFFYPFPDLWNKFFGLAGGFVGVIIAVFVGSIPGCGPQIAFASFYLGIGGNSSSWAPGLGPVSDAAMTANSINQDGDASFPLLAMNRTSWWYMQVINICPGLIVGGLLLLANGGTIWSG